MPVLSNNFGERFFVYEGARRWASVCIQGDMLIWEVNVIKGNTLTDHVPSVACTSCTVGHMRDGPYAGLVCV